jgi:AP-4 complex subunit mu-1
MNYRSSADFKSPFSVVTAIDDTSTPYQITAEIRVRATFSDKLACAGLAVRFQTPKSRRIVNATCTLEKNAPPGSQHAAWHAKEDRHVLWQLKRVRGGDEHSLRVSMSTREPRVPEAKKECGPVSLGFTIPTLNCSNLRVRYLTVQGSNPAGVAGKQKKAPADGPHRWVRYVTKSNNFVARV